MLFCLTNIVFSSTKGPIVTLNNNDVIPSNNIQTCINNILLHPICLIITK